MLYNDEIDLEKISETRKPSEGSLISINKDGTSTSQPYGEIITIKYKCPCGKGEVVLIDEDIPGYRDWYVDVDCKDCKEKYEILWGKGVLPGHSPMVRKKIYCR